jgi:hypothetical protein
MIVLALVVLVTGLALAYFTRTTTDRQLAQSSYNDTSADLLARSALDIIVGDFKQEIINDPRVATRTDIQPQRYGDASIPNLIRRSFSGDPTNRTSSVSSSAVSANGRSINTTRWNSHYLIPKGNTNTTDSSPVPSFTSPDWVLVTAQGPTPAPSPNAVIGRYAVAVYDEGGLLDMSVAGYPSWTGNPTGTCDPAPTPWLVNVGRKGTVGFADLTALGTYAPPQTQIDNIVGWRNYAMTQRTASSFGSFNYSGETDCAKQNWYGSYLLYFGDPPFLIDSLSDKLLASTYPFTSVANYAYPTPGPGATPRTDQALMTRQELLRLRSSLGFSQNVLQYMGTFSRERNRPAPDWPNLQNNLSEGRFNLNNFALLVPNPSECIIAHGKKKGWQNGKNKNHLCGTTPEIVSLFGLFWVKASTIDPGLTTPGHWKYIGRVVPPPNPNDNPNAHHGISCFRGPNQQNDFFQILNFAFNQSQCATEAALAKVFGVGASLIDQYDSGDACPPSGNNPFQPEGCDLDYYVVGTNGRGNNWSKQAYATHTTVIEYGHNSGAAAFAFGMEPDYSNGDHVNGDDAPNRNSNNPHRPCGGQGGNCAPGEPSAPAPGTSQIVNHFFSNVGELGYGIDTSTGGLPTLNFSSPNFPDAPILDFLSYNPVSSAYPRAGIVNLYTRNAPVLAAMLSGTLKTDAAAANPAPTPVVTASQAMDAATRIVQETQNVLAGSPGYGPVTQTDMTRAIAARLVAAGAAAPSWSGSTTEQKQSIARALAEMGQTRTWNLFIDVIAQTGRYAPEAANVTQANQFIVEGEKRYWLHIALGRDLVHTDGTPCLPGDTGCQVDVLGTQLEEVIE